MKKTLFAFILLLGLFFIPIPNVNAATSNSVAGITDTDGANLNVRKSNSINSLVITKLSDNSYLTIINTTGNWYYVEYKDNQYGYVHKDYINVVSSNTKRVNTGGSNLNVRTGPSTNYLAFDKISDNDYVVVLSSSNGWARVLFEGNKIGYVSTSYLANTTTYKSIKLNVPSYKQYDSRWAYNEVGSSGKTMKQIGCLTTAMAMSESYRRNTTITPLYYESISSYTSSGNMYWPSNYSFITSSTNYLSKIYNLLNQGKPVVIGCKNSSGSQHWVLVYGYNGSNSLSSSNFLIYDPGSSTRTTLNQFLNSYPTFYKIAYYN